MQNKLKILIADNQTEFGETYGKVLENYGMEVFLCAKDGI